MVGIQRIVSGGQTGVDRAALDVALESGISCGGWCPKGRKAEDGKIPDHYPLEETKSRRYTERTMLNVRESDGTLVITRGKPTGGTALTLGMARKEVKPILVVRPEDDVKDSSDWILREGIQVLNIAGPRESGDPGIYTTTLSFLRRLLR
ncbi:putative molybdenum carrier protein [bacterium]|nr:putative molybdenum carrier protein [bacterium]